MTTFTAFTNSQNGYVYPRLDILLDYKEGDKLYMSVQNNEGKYVRTHFEVIERMEDVISTYVHNPWIEREFRIMKID